MKTGLDNILDSASTYVKELIKEGKESQAKKEVIDTLESVKNKIDLATSSIKSMIDEQINKSKEHEDETDKKVEETKEKKDIFNNFFGTKTGDPINDFLGAMDTLFGDEVKKPKVWEDLYTYRVNKAKPKDKICYIALTKDEAIKAIQKQALTKNVVAYEYEDNIRVGEGEVVLAVKLDMSNVLDLTHTVEYLEHSRHRYSIDKPLIRQVAAVSDIPYSTNFKIVYIIRDNRCVNGIYKI